MPIAPNLRITIEPRVGSAFMPTTSERLLLRDTKSTSFGGKRHFFVGSFIVSLLLSFAFSFFHRLLFRFLFGFFVFVFPFLFFCFLCFRLEALVMQMHENVIWGESGIYSFSFLGENQSNKWGLCWCVFFYFFYFFIGRLGSVFLCVSKGRHAGLCWVFLGSMAITTSTSFREGERLSHSEISLRNTKLNEMFQYPVSSSVHSKEYLRLSNCSK